MSRSPRSTLRLATETSPAARFDSFPRAGLASPETPRSGLADLLALCLTCYGVGYFLGHVLTAVVRDGWPFGVAL